MTTIKYVIYDEEVYPNVFTNSFVFDNGQGMRTFELSDRKNQIVEMIEFLRKVRQHDMKMVGFNNLGFDYPVLHYILKKNVEATKSKKPLVITAKEIYDFAQKIFQSENRFEHTVWYRDWETNPKIGRAHV